MVQTAHYDNDRIVGLQEALARLREKSRSFYLASGCFQGRLRIDLILLYSFCRVADDLVDNAPTISEAQHWISKLREYLDLSYNPKASANRESVKHFVNFTFPKRNRSALLLLPTSYISSAPLYDLLRGFETDLKFSSLDRPFPISDEQTLQLYAARVAGTVAELCLELVFCHSKGSTSEQQRQGIVRAGGRMGIALQYVNIARDITVDARNSRVYLPTDCLKLNGMVPEDVVRDPASAKVEALRQRLLDKAMQIYEETKEAIELLPVESRAPMRVAVESYVEIGRVLQERGYKIKAGRATVRKSRRLRVAWNALRKG